MRKPFLDRFWEKVDKSGECWIWTSATWGSGYGFFWVGGEQRSEYAHRVSWEIATGAKVPSGRLVCHTCDNKLCVNPAHLFLGSAQDNRDDCVSKGRHAAGERNGGGGKLKWSDVREIRRLSGSESSRLTAERFGVSRQTIKQIRRGRLWKEHTIGGIYG